MVTVGPGFLPKALPIRTQQARSVLWPMRPVVVSRDGCLGGSVPQNGSGTDATEVLAGSRSLQPSAHVLSVLGVRLSEEALQTGLFTFHDLSQVQ